MTDDAAGKRTRGRPQKYKPEYAEQAAKVCEIFAATDHDLARNFGVSLSTIYNWKLKHPEFLDALKLGKNPPDDRVERSLFERAVGYSVMEEKVFQHNGKIVRTEVLKHYPPDVTACLAWLNNRRPDKWRQRQEGVQLDAETIAAVITKLNDEQRTLV